MKPTFIRIAVALWTFGAALPAAAQSVESRVATEVRNADGNITASGEVETCARCLVQHWAGGTRVGQGATSQSHGEGTAYTDFGALKTYSRVVSAGPEGSADATSSATFTDYVIIDSPGLIGQQGTVMVPIALAYTFMPTGTPSNGYLQLLVNLPSRRTYERSGYFASNGEIYSTSRDPGTGTIPIDTPINATFDFVYGRGFNITMSLLTRARVTEDGAATFDASHSAYWGGFSSLTDDSGNAVTIYSVTSGSGTDWSKPYASAVPEPGTYALLLGGVGLIGAALRRPRRPIERPLAA